MAIFANFISVESPILTVTFTDTSSGDTPDRWFWDFGDGNFSFDQNPVHTYAIFGKYRVALTASIVTETAIFRQTSQAGSILKDVFNVASIEPTTWTDWVAQDFITLDTDRIVQWQYSNSEGPVVQTDDFRYRAAKYNGVAFDMASIADYDQAILNYKITSIDNNLSGSTVWDFEIEQAVSGVSFLPTSIKVPEPPFNGRVIGGDITDALGTNPIFTITDKADFKRSGLGRARQSSSPGSVGYSSNLVTSGDDTTYIDIYKFSASETVAAIVEVDRKVFGDGLIIDFVGTPLIGDSPLDVKFTDLSTVNAVKSVWDFGDGTTLIVAGNTNPTNIYTTDACSVY